MATKVQLEAMVKKVIELQYYGETVHAVTFDPFYLLIHTANCRTIKIDTDGKEN